METPDQRQPEIKNPEPRIPENKGPVGRLIEKMEEVKTKPVKVHWWDRAWLWMNGKKTYAGIGLTIAGGIMMLIPGTQAAGWATIGKGVAYLGGILTTGGILHKILKNSKIGEPGKFGNKELLELIIGVLEAVIKLMSKVKKTK